MGALRQHDLELIEGKKEVRDRYVSKVEVLDRVGKLALLPDNETATTEMVAEFYNVPKSTIEAVVFDHRDEMVSDGYNVLTKEKLKEFKGSLIKASNLEGKTDTGTNLYNKLKYARQIAIFPKRAILRIGMLLRDSEVAKEVRNYLLNIEESATASTKETILNRDNLSEKEHLILQCITFTIENGGMLAEGIQKAAAILKFKESTVQSLWYYKVKNHAKQEILDKISSNRGSKMKKQKNTAAKVYEIKDYKNIVEEATLYKMKCKQLEEDNVRLKQSNEKLTKINKKLKSEYQVVMNVIGKAMKMHTKDELKYYVNKDGIVKI